MLQVLTGEGVPPIPMVGEQVVGLSWILKGCCFANCGQVSTHKQASQTLLIAQQVHALMDACCITLTN